MIRRKLQLDFTATHSAWRLCMFALALSVLALLSNTTFAQGVSDGFAPTVDGTITVVRTQADGKILIGGVFNNVNGVPHKSLARLNRNGALDSTFSAVTNGTVNDIIVQADGAIVIGGNFTQVNGTARTNLARVSGTDGTLDATPNLDFSGPVYALAQQPQDGRLLVGGSFIAIGNTSVQRVARLFPNGGVDGTFTASADNSVDQFALQPNGQIVLVGHFANVNGQAHARMARLNYNGSLDQSFNPSADLSVAAVAVQADGRILVGGNFTTLNGQSRNHLGRLNADGTLDAFNPNLNDSVIAVKIQADGKIVAAGAFTTANGQTRPRVARFKFDGTLDSFVAVPDNTVFDVAVEADGDLIAVGSFTAVNVTPHQRIVRLHTFVGELDEDFIADTDGYVSSLAHQADGRILVGGAFNTLGGWPSVGLGRMRPDGHVDTSFTNPNANGPVYTVVALPDGKMLVGGFFDSIGGGAHSGLARLNNNGTLDASFSGVTGAGQRVYAIAVQADGKVVIGGAFTQVNGVARANIARLNANGTLDNTFNPGANDIVNSLAVQADGQIIAAGSFTTMGGFTRNRIARLTSGGSIDANYNPNVNNTIQTILLQGTGKLLIGGSFTTAGGQTHNRIARINSDGAVDGTFTIGANDDVYSLAAHFNGIVVAAGKFTLFGGQSHPRIARIEANGAVNPFYYVGGANLDVQTLLIAPDGKLLIGGIFSSAAGESRGHLARFSLLDVVTQRIQTDNVGSGLYWQFVDGQISSITPEFARVTFELSTDGVNFSALGEATRTVSGWQVTGLTLTPNQLYFARARGFYASSTGSGSGSLIERVETVKYVPCSFTVSPLTQSINAAGGTMQVSVVGTTQACGWATQSNAAWLAIVPPASGQGTTTVSFNATANNGAQRTGTVQIAGQTITVTQASQSCPTITINPSNIAAATQGQLYNQQLTTVGGTAPYQFTLIGTLPNGVTLNPATGLISGTPTVSGVFQIQVSVHDIGCGEGLRAYNLTVNGNCQTITVNPATVPNATVNTAYTQTFTQAGGVAPVTLTLVGQLPNGLTYNQGTATLSGTPTQAGSFNFTVTATGASGCQGVRNYTLTVNQGQQQAKAKKGDFDGDGKADLAVWTGATGNWMVLKSGNNQVQNIQWGAGFAPYNDVIVPGDYDGDGKIDHAIWRGADSIWYIRKSSDGQAILQLYGTSNAPYFDQPTPGDFDGDGKTDLAVWRPSAGVWFVRRSSDDSDMIGQLGQQGDVPVAADYDGDGKADFAVFRPSAVNAPNWFILQSSTNTVVTFTWGAGYAPYNDVPVPADYDGDGKADLAIWRGADSVWYIRPSANPNAPILQLWGTSNAPYFDTPCPADYDGDGKADIAVWRKDGTWFVLRSANNTNLIQVHGQNGDAPVPAKGVW